MPPEEPLGRAAREQGEATEIDVDGACSPRKEVEQAGSEVTDLALAAEQAAMQAMYNFQTTAQDAPARDTAHPPSLPREWPMARMCISYKQVNKYVRTVIWRRVGEFGSKSQS